jgi:hypothetical protein
MTLPLHHENQQEKNLLANTKNVHINHLTMPAIYRWPLSYKENCFYRMVQPNNTEVNQWTLDQSMHYSIYKVKIKGTPLKDWSGNMH